MIAEKRMLMVVNVHVGVVEQVDVHVRVEATVDVAHHSSVVVAASQGHYQLLGFYTVPGKNNSNNYLT